MLPEVEIRNLLGAFLFSGDDVKKTVGMLSGGEKARLLLAKLAMDHSNFLVLDEPTNHLDVNSREVLENALINFEGTILFVSHDRYFINRVATKILEISSIGSTLYLGDYDYYLEKKSENELSSTPENPVKESTSIDSRKEQKQYAKERRKLQREFDELELEITAINKQVNKIHEEMLAKADNFELLATLQKELDLLEKNSDILEMRWIEIMEKLE